MESMRRQYLPALLILLAGVVGAALVVMVPVVLDPQRDLPVWIPAALGCAFLALVALARRERRNLEPGRR